MNPLFALALKLKSDGLAEGKKTLSALDAQGKALAARFTGVSKAYAGIAAAGALVAVGKFLKSSIEEAAEAEKVMGELKLAVENVGGNFAVISSELDGAANRMAKFTRFSDDTTRGALSRMILISGDTAGAIENIGLAADIAAAKQISLESAAEKVAKVMAGNTRGLKEFGIMTKDSGEALDQLRTKFKGFADQDGRSLQGRLVQIRNAWGEILEATGNALTGENNLPDALGRIAEKLNEVAGYIDKNGDKWRGWAKNMLDPTWGPANILNKLTTALNNAGLAMRDWGNMGFAGLGPRRAGGGGGGGGRDVPTGPLSLPGVTVMAGGHSTPPPGGGGGTKTGKEKSLIPNIDLSSTNQATLDSIADKLGSAFKDPFEKFDMSDFAGMSTEKLKEMFEEQAKAVKEGKKKVEDALIEHTEMIQARADWMADTIGGAIQNGIIAAFEGGGVSGAIAAFGKTILAAIGDMMVQKGTAMIAEGLIMAGLVPFLSNPFTSGPALIAAGSALTALGATLGAISTGGARGGTSAGGHFSSGRSTQEITRLQFVNRPSYAGNVKPLQMNQFVFFGANDPKLQRQFEVVLEKQQRRKG